MLCFSVGILHFWQFLDYTFFVLQIEYKPFEWLVIISNPNDMSGRWIWTSCKIIIFTIGTNLEY